MTRRVGRSGEHRKDPRKDGWSENDPAYAQNADGWPRILSRLKTLLETGKTFKPH